MTRFDDYLAEQLQNPEFRAEWEALQPAFAIVQAMIDAQRKTGLTKKQLAEKTNISQAYITKLENGNGNPSIKTLQRLAAGMDMVLHIEFLPVAGQ